MKKIQMSLGIYLMNIQAFVLQFSMFFTSKFYLKVRNKSGSSSLIFLDAAGLVNVVGQGMVGAILSSGDKFCLSPRLDAMTPRRGRIEKDS